MKHFKMSSKNGVFSLRFGELLINISKVYHPVKPLVPVKKSKSETQIIRDSARYKKFKKRCREELKHECWCCGSKKQLEIHHILSIEECLQMGNREPIFDVKNAVHLCNKCHKQFHLDYQLKLNEKKAEVLVA